MNINSYKKILDRIQAKKFNHSLNSNWSSTSYSFLFGTIKQDISISKYNSFKGVRNTSISNLMKANDNTKRNTEIIIILFINIILIISLFIIIRKFKKRKPSIYRNQNNVIIF